MTSLHTTAMWEPALESMDRRKLQELQTQRLLQTVEQAYTAVPFYRSHFDLQSIDIQSIRNLDDIARLPFTEKEHFRQNYPYGMFAVPMRNIVRIHSSSGTTGKPTVVGYTRRDLDTWSNMIARLLFASGVTEEDVIQIAFGYGLFTGGFGLHYGAEKIGASVIPISSGNTQKQLMIMKDYLTTALICTPSYAMYLAEAMESEGIAPADLRLRTGLFGGEPWTAQMRQQIENRLGITATDNYGLSEVMGPGVACECLEQKGMHINEDTFYPEIIDPQTLEVLPHGQWGELVITTLHREALPVIRYRTRDITRLNPEPCACGRTFLRMEKPSGRSDDMLIIRGVNVFPTQIEEVLCRIDDCEPHYKLVVERVGSLDELEVLVEVNERLFFDEMKKQNALIRRIQSEIRSMIGISAKVRLVEKRTLERFEGKSKRVLDKRNTSG
ncbi:phenylacetate--CoA ligase family protein [Desulfurispira natronophila]|uniref:Phenylacetate-coenzyme A ligase n=1 Tax=Desulfurispira natronophila TaxID=682562 RepID=A0A7W8DHT7_9BACT|nr:phenylacetate--CoA ligase [Desulfurispira natronophila]MBB5022697.1 phenylacetate-CoA ligase [Desulfurispira natronophila]